MTYEVGDAENFRVSVTRGQPTTTTTTGPFDHDRTLLDVVLDSRVPPEAESEMAWVNVYLVTPEQRTLMVSQVYNTHHIDAPRWTPQGYVTSTNVLDPWDRINVRAGNTVEVEHTPNVAVIGFKMAIDYEERP